MENSKYCLCPPLSGSAFKIAVAAAIAMAGGALLGGCAAPPTAAEIQKKIEFSLDPNLKTTNAQGPRLGNPQTDSFYIERVMSNDLISDSIIVMHTSRDWAFLKSAKDDSGEEFNVRHPATGIVPGSVMEAVSLELPAGYLTEHAATGIKIQVVGAHGNATVTFDPSYVQAMLAAMSQAPKP